MSDSTDALLLLLQAGNALKIEHVRQHLIIGMFSLITLKASQS